jgi:hypothetical protein
MRSRLHAIVIAAALASPYAVSIVAQSLNAHYLSEMRSVYRVKAHGQAHVGQTARTEVSDPPYVSQFPSAVRVFAEIKGKDPMDTAARQMGAFWQLKEIIKELSGFRWVRNETSPGEKRLLGEYTAGYTRAAQPYAHIANSPEHPDRPKWYQMHASYETSDAFREELFTRFLTPTLLAQYRQIKGDTRATVAANRQAREQAWKEEKAAAEKAAAAETAAGVTAPAWQRQIARCIAAGFSESDCMQQRMKQEFHELMPAWARNKPKMPGLTISGVYSGQGQFSATFGPQGRGSITCGEASAAANFHIERQGNQLHLRLLESTPADLLGFGSDALEKLTPQGTMNPTAWQDQQVVWTWRADGKLAASSPIRVTGNVYTGTATSTSGETVRLYRPVTRTCTPGVLTATGKATAAALGTSVAEGTSTALGAMVDILGGSDPIGNIAARAPNPGLRMDGQYVGGDGFDLEFQPSAAVIGCREAVVARDYTVSANGGRILVTIQNGGTPVVLELKSDGTLAGSGQVRVDGRVITGVNKNDQIQFMPVTATCTLGMLTPSSR